ncbi:15355_t:CDS:1, partial [Funneliformis caledonium]
FVPEYIISSLSAIAIMGDSPYGLCEKIIWFFRCFGCPFDGLFYSFNVRGGKKSCCLYWLSANYFKLENNDGTYRHPKYRPFGFYAMKLKDKEDIKEYVKQCTARLPVLERFSLLITSYYIIVGVKEGISMIKGTIVCKDWAYLPLLFSWTLFSIWKRGIYGIQVVKDPKEVFKKNIEIIVNDNPINKSFRLTITALISIVVPWVTVLIVYLTPPVGYFCRSKYVTVISSIWSFNSALAFFYHMKGECDLIMSEESDSEFVSEESEESDPEKTEVESEKREPAKTEKRDPEKTGKFKGIRKFAKKLKRMRCLHIWFSMSGLIVSILVLFLGIFTGYNTLWVDLFGDACDLSSVGCY